MIRSKSILPPNTTPLLRDLEAATSSRLYLLSNDVRYLNNPDLCPAHILPWLAWAVSVDVWSDDWTEQQKRAVIRQSILVHKQKGTLGALHRALAIFAYAQIVIKEWFNYGGEPFTFKAFIKLIESGHNYEDLNNIYQTIIQTKNLRSHLDDFNIELETRSQQPTTAIAFGTIETITIYPYEQ
jgi:phage tail P2-like protein